jgi:hypothetical protein
MSRCITVPLLSIGLGLLGCRRSPAPDSAPSPPPQPVETFPAEASPAWTEAGIPDVRHRGWTLVQEPTGGSETLVQVWAPGDHLKQAFTVAVPDLYRRHYHFAEWSHGSLFAIRRIGDTNTETWTDELWEYPEGRAPRRIASGRGLDFRVSPDGRRILVVAADSTSDTAELARILDRTGKVLASRSTAEYDRETFEPLDMGDSIAYLGADVDQDLHRWSLAADSLVPVALPEEAIEDRLVLADRDVLVASDHPLMADADEAEVFRKARTPVVLRAFHLRDGRQVELARAVARQFHPVLGENDSLEIDTDTPDSTTNLPPPEFRVPRGAAGP